MLDGHAARLDHVRARRQPAQRLVESRRLPDHEVRSIAEVTSAQIYRGREGQQGEPVARLERPRDDDSYDCKQIGDALAQEIESHPTAFYVAVNTTEYPNGAIRGQVNPAG